MLLTTLLSGELLNALARYRTLEEYRILKGGIDMRNVTDITSWLPQKRDEVPVVTWRTMRAPVIDIREAVSRLQSRAYEWASKESERYKTFSRRLVIEDDSTMAQNSDRLDALFVGPNNEALLCQFWPKKEKICYIWVCNLGDLEQKAPLYVDYMRKKGMSLYFSRHRTVA
ncbi:hypothetical protein IKF73_00250 [Candidatus Saccharibacteria bacterium]|nr:hypothetical protein [Candidatus Saccharibacteria bacterium]